MHGFVFMKRFAFLAGFYALCSCNSGSDTTGTNTPVDSLQPVDSTIKVDTAIKYSPSPDTSFGIRLPSGTISLQQWDTSIHLEEYLGKPLKTKTKQLDLNSDTFAGSFIRDMQFDGLSLKLFSPKQNGRSFWIQEIILTNDKYKTTRGIKPGDELDKVKQAYPSLEKFPGDNKNMYYVANEGYEKSIEMEFEKNKLKKLRMYYMLN